MIEDGLPTSPVFSDDCLGAGGADMSCQTTVCHKCSRTGEVRRAEGDVPVCGLS